MATERLREFRDWLNLIFTIFTVAILPIFWLAQRNQRLEIREEMRQQYITTETFKAENAKLSAENTKLGAEITLLNAKLDRIQIQLVRLTDAVKLRPDAP